MSRLDDTYAQPRPHYCDPPDITTWDTDAEPYPRLVSELAPGTRWFCGCGQVWVVRMAPELQSAHTVVVAHLEWAPETRRQRRERTRRRRLLSLVRRPR